MGRSPCRMEEGEGLNRGAWTAQEDKLLTSCIEAHGEGKWTLVPRRAGLNRSGKSCRLRWLNYLRPDIKRGNITHDEEELMIRLHKLLGNRWALIAGRLPGRTDNEIKNYWNTTLAKKLRTQSSSCPLMSEQHPTTSKSTASEPDVSPPQVIQPKASRCKNVVILDPPYPQENLLSSNQIDFDEARLTTQFTSQYRASYASKADLVDDEYHQFNEDHNSDVNLLSPGRNEFQDQLSAADFSTYFNLDIDSNTPGDDMDLHVDQSTPIDELMVNCWTTSETEDNATMDLDFSALLLDSGDWPWLHLYH